MDIYVILCLYLPTLYQSKLLIEKKNNKIKKPCPLQGNPFQGNYGTALFQGKIVNSVTCT